MAGESSIALPLVEPCLPLPVPAWGETTADRVSKGQLSRGRISSGGVTRLEGGKRDMPGGAKQDEDG